MACPAKVPVSHTARCKRRRHPAGYGTCTDGVHLRAGPGRALLGLYATQYTPEWYMEGVLHPARHPSQTARHLIQRLPGIPTAEVSGYLRLRCPATYGWVPATARVGCRPLPVLGAGHCPYNTASTPPYAVCAGFFALKQGQPGSLRHQLSLGMTFLRFRLVNSPARIRPRMLL